MSETVTTVTVTVIGHDNVVGVSGSYVAEGETIGKVIADQKADAISNFEDDGGSAPYRVLVSVITLPLPEEMPHTEITATVTGASSEPVKITADIS